MIEAVLGSPIRAVEWRGTDEPDPPLPEEAAGLGEVIDRRTRDFAAGRQCARRALALLGLPPTAIPIGPDREPSWPQGIAGSITHCDGYAAAAVARADEVAALGIDAEPHAPLPAGVLRRVAGPDEAAWLASVAGPTCWDRVIFSAKESVYKAWFPLAGRWLGFQDAVVEVDPTAGTFRARLLVPGPEIGGGALTAFDGRFAVSDGLVLTAVVLSAG